ncbi:S10 family peptidase [Beijerinckia indica]|uniref:Peptidase S10 serine carboxypeptidase n=1 Tax=Beijerinckia indica subsp. indica (strain ATCC 9039 / DSM 1715 / NCIMB 8712) TaxID=395963 RepID=B2IJ74_BEII9|nr:peptidase S10 [Beijerinckia indica]ACB94837.1 peptidase S10 serine carboxypeptidase [Beijerinckia indica subsp. indica ATCC 9039]
MPAEQSPPPSDKPVDSKPIEKPKQFITRHEGHFHGRPVAYQAIAGETHLKDKNGKPKASLFSFAYLAEETGDPSLRPITFLFNGGPGSASLWLHMGAFGPKRVLVPGDGAFAKGPPYPLQDNPACCLDLTDLVFIDPVGTGFSRPLGEAKPEDFWGLEEDATLIAEFIKQFLTDHKRWASPRYLGGESYGTTRSVLTAGKLHGGLAGVAFNGLALISVILDFHTANFEKGNILPDVSYLPTYAATALHHSRIDPAPSDREAFLDEVRRFAIEDYAPALLAGNRLAPERRKEIALQLARYTGLAEAWIERAHLRLSPSRYRKELLRDQGLTVGRFDTRYCGLDYDNVGETPDDDPAAYAVKGAYTTAMQDYLGRVLEVELDEPYIVFSMDALKKWKWTSTQEKEVSSWPGYINVAPELGRLQRECPSLKILMANGLFDLATPFFAVENTIAGNGIDADRIRMRYYEAGHMMYVNEACLAALVEDFRELITN